MRLEILTIGDEILSGNIVDTNTAYLSDRLWMNGFEVTYHTGVRDDPATIKEALHLSASRADVVLVTGGLGPTADDFTVEIAAKTFGKPLVVDKSALRHLVTLYRKWKRPLTDNNRRQALVPQGARTLVNKMGTAPGIAATFKKTSFYFFPGVPKEMKHLFEDYILPELIKKRRDKIVFESVMLKCFGAPESQLDLALKDLYRGRTSIGSVRVGFRAHFPEIFIKLSAWGKDRRSARQQLNLVRQQVQDRVGSYFYGEGEDTLESVVSALMIQKKMTIALAESCTGGLLANRFTNISGASSFLMAGVVSYSNESKIKILGVPATTIRKYGAVSRETAIAMAEGVRKLSKTGYGIGITGIAGPTGGTKDKPVGTVHIAMVRKGLIWEKQFSVPRSRSDFKTMVTSMALDKLRRDLLKLK